MLLIVCLYNRILVIARLSIGERPTSIRRIGYGVAFNFEVIRYKTLLDLLNLSRGFSRDVATLDLTSIDNKSD